MKNNEITIKLSRTRIILLEIGSIAFVALSVWLLKISRDASWIYFIIICIFLVMAILFFGTIGILGFKKLLDKRSGLTITPERIIDNSSVLGKNTIIWKDIIKINTLKLEKTNILLFHMKNSHETIRNAKGLKRFMMRLSNKLYGTPVSISPVSLKCSFDEFFEIVAENCKKYNPEALIITGEEDLSLKNWYNVEWDDENIYRNVSPPGKAPWSDSVKWKEIIRICFEATGYSDSDRIYIFTEERDESYLIPVEAKGGADLWNEIISRKLFDAELAIKAAASVGGLFCCPHDESSDTIMNNSD